MGIELFYCFEQHSNCTLEVGNPPGYITIERVRKALELGYIVGSCSDQPISHQQGMWSELGISVRCRQSNSEGEFIEWIHDAYDTADGLIVNPGAWSHYSYAIRDALELLEVPFVEVHLSDIESREDWRRSSVVSDLAAKRVSGKGPDGYREALQFLVERVGAAQ